MNIKGFILTVLFLLIVLCACSPAIPEEHGVNTAPDTGTAISTEANEAIETTVPQTTAAEPALKDFSEYEELISNNGDDRNWITAAMGCVFEAPQEIDLNFMFYLGTGFGGWSDISPESEQYLIGHGFIREMDLQVMPAGDINDILLATFGISIADVVIPQKWLYIQAEDAYCSNHNDAYHIGRVSITDVIESEDSTVTIYYTVDTYYNCKTDEFLDHPCLALTLQKSVDGQWLICSNTVVK